MTLHQRRDAATIQRLDAVVTGSTDTDRASLGI